ncbi:unnamed protein product [Staurois parvus]|uniref:Uncharacterized protein n=1 Tax=Staurois parvus TaxID=386267 RepID=A0ABN9GW69_9NEOB|nr:unnamed protein product [Staurois parvus]
MPQRTRHQRVLRLPQWNYYPQSIAKSSQSIAKSPQSIASNRRASQVTASRKEKSPYKTDVCFCNPQITISCSSIKVRAFLYYSLMHIGFCTIHFCAQENTDF